MTTPDSLPQKAIQYPPNSRYYGIEVVQRVTGPGAPVAYLRRRFLPRAERLALAAEHVVQEHDRPDGLAYQYFGDPEQSWRIADANAAMHPADLTAEPGRTLRITLPEGILGAAGLG